MPAAVEQGIHRARALMLACLVTLAASVGLMSAAGTAEAARCANRSATPNQVSNAKLEKAIVCLINVRRDNAGRRKVGRVGDLDQAASRHTRTMLNHDCYSHECPGEPPLKSRLFASGYLPAPNPRYGEVIGLQRTPRKVVAQWMRTGGHRKILLRRGYRHVGVGAAEGVPIPGYSDNGIITATAILGRRG